MAQLFGGASRERGEDYRRSVLAGKRVVAPSSLGSSSAMPAGGSGCTQLRRSLFPDERSDADYAAGLAASLEQRGGASVDGTADLFPIRGRAVRDEVILDVLFVRLLFIL